MTSSLGLEARHDKPTGGSSGVDQLLGRETGPRTEVGEVPFHSTWPDAHDLGRVSDGSTGVRRAPSRATVRPRVADPVVTWATRRFVG